MENEILTTILKNTFTVSQLKHRLLILKLYLTEQLFGSANHLALEEADFNWLKSLDETFYQKFTQDNVYQILTEALTQTNQIVPLIIYLPFELNEGVSAQIGSFARTTFALPSLLLEVKYDPSLLAGCALSWKGIFRDYSLRAKIEEKKAEILLSFKKYLR